MPLEILVPFVVIAVSVIMLVITRSGLSRQARLSSDQAVAARFGIDFPECTVADIMIDDDRCTALLIMQDTDAVGLVRAIGDRTTTRMLNAGALFSVVERDTGLVVTSTDFTWPRHVIQLAGAAERARWRTVLMPFCVETHADKVAA